MKEITIPLSLRHKLIGLEWFSAILKNYIKHRIISSFFYEYKNVQSQGLWDLGDKKTCFNLMILLFISMESCL